MNLDVHVEIAAETLFHIGPVPVTNSMATMWGVMAIIILVFWAAARKKQVVPGKFQSIIEMVVDFVKNLVEGAAGKTLGRKFLPLILGLFVFIFFANMAGLLPGMGTIGKYEESSHEVVAGETHEEGAADVTHEEVTTDAEGAAVTATTEEHEPAVDEVTAAEAKEEIVAEEEHGGKVLVPFLRAPNADLNMTLAMSLIAIITVQVAGIRAHGFKGRIKHMADPPFLFPIELIGEVSRVVSLGARLFGNVFAGEVLLGVMFALGAALKIAVAPMLFPVIFMFLEVMFGTIQALVFSLLVMIYIALAAATHGHDEEHDEHAATGNHGAAHSVGD